MASTDVSRRGRIRPGSIGRQPYPTTPSTARTLSRDFARSKSSRERRLHALMDDSTRAQVPVSPVIEEVMSSPEMDAVRRVRSRPAPSGTSTIELPVTVSSIGVTVAPLPGATQAQSREGIFQA